MPHCLGELPWHHPQELAGEGLPVLLLDALTPAHHVCCLVHMKWVFSVRKIVQTLVF